MRFFHSPGSSSEGILLLLQECGAPFDVEVIDLRTRKQREPSYLSRNPKGKVPALQRADGSVLTEFPAIAFWIAKSFPQARLIGQGIEAEARALELVDFIVSSVHMRGFTLMRMPQKFSTSEAAQADLVAHGRSEFVAGLDHLSEVLGDKDYMLGDFGIADGAAWYVLRFARAFGIAMPDNLERLHDRIAARRSRGGQDTETA